MHFKKICKKHLCVLIQCRCPGPKSVQMLECPPDCPGREKETSSE